MSRSRKFRGPRECDMDNNTSKVVIKCLPVTQPIGTFYIGAMSPSDLVDISYADIRRIARDDEEYRDVASKENKSPDVESPDVESSDIESAFIEEMDSEFVSLYAQDFEEFLGIQRQLSPKRVKELRQYVGHVDAAFPTSVLIALSSSQASYDEETSTISIVRNSNAAKIIDGQHRIDGLRGYKGPQFDVNVSVFIDMDLQDQAMVFATINLTQTKVNKSLAYDLYEFTKTRSPQRTAHDIVRFLNYKEGSPLFSKVKMLGTGSGEGQETITQATFVDRLLRYVSKNPMIDRDTLRRSRKLSRISGSERDRQIFRNWFIDERDVNTTLVLWNYFLAVQARWPNSWNNVVQGNILNRTTGFGALMRFLRVAYNSREKPDDVVLREEFAEIFANMTLEEGKFTPDDYVPGSSGERKLFDALVEQSGLHQFR